MICRLESVQRAGELRFEICSLQVSPMKPSAQRHLPLLVHTPPEAQAAAHFAEKRGGKSALSMPSSSQVCLQLCIALIVQEPSATSIGSSFVSDTLAHRTTLSLASFAVGISATTYKSFDIIALSGVNEDVALVTKVSLKLKRDDVPVNSEDE